MITPQFPFCNKGWLILALPLLIFFVGCSSGPDESEAVEGPGFFTTFYSDDVLRTRLSVNMDSILFYKDHESEREEDGIFEIDLDTGLLVVPVEVRSRGVTRKKICSFPPLRVQIKKNAVRKNGWGDYRNYKLVTHCFDTLYEDQLLFKEYLTYKMYEKLTSHSLRAQLLEMDYIFAEDTLHRYAVLLENDDEMCARLGLTALDIDKTKLTSIHFDHYKRFALFQYMVGNTDWNLSTGHNTMYVLSEGSSTPIVIPYDFDYCGIVNAPYATPFETIPISNVRERYFMYRGKKTDDFDAIHAEFIALKGEWMNMIEEFTLISDEGKAEIVGYLNEFFLTLEKPDWKDHVFPT